MEEDLATVTTNYLQRILTGKITFTFMNIFMETLERVLALGTQIIHCLSLILH